MDEKTTADRSPNRFAIWPALKAVAFALLLGLVWVLMMMGMASELFW